MRKYRRSAVLILLFVSFLLGSFTTAQASFLPESFVYVTDFVPDAILEIRYYSTYNFVGTRVDDYWAPLAILTKEAAIALRQASDNLREQGYAIKVFDAYRPQGAVDHFMRWGADSQDIAMKEYFYPDLDKSDIDPNVTDQYIASRSGHSRGSTVDLTLINLKTGHEVDMGSPFDLFGPISAHDYAGPELTATQKANRLILKNAMDNAGFNSYSDEWWHYTLRNAPYSGVYFKFPVMRSNVISWPTPPKIDISTLPEGVVGKNYNLTLDVSGTTPINWVFDSGKLPDGLNINNGVISGAPTTEGTFNFTVRMENVIADNIKDLSITVASADDKYSGCNASVRLSVMVAMALIAIALFVKKRQGGLR